MANFEKSGPSTLGISLTAAMLMAACGGSDPAAPTTDAPPVADAPPIVQPVWGSMGVLVAPGQTSKTFSWPDGTCTVGEGLTPIFNASLTVASNGDLTFKAASNAGGQATDRITIPVADSTSREFNFYASSRQLQQATYKMSISGGDVFKIFEMSSSDGGTLDFNDITAGFDYDCAGGPITLANLTPATAFLPSEQRAAQQFLAGANEVDSMSEDHFAAVITAGAFVWSPNYLNNDLTNGVSLNLSNGQLSKGTRTSAISGLSNPEPLLYSGVLDSGSYKEAYDKGADRRSVELSIGNSFSQRISRIINELSVSSLL